MLATRQATFLILFVGVLLTLLNALVIHAPLLGTLAMLMIGVTLAKLYGEKFAHPSVNGEQFFWGSLMVLATYILSCSLAYYISGITLTTAIDILFVPILVCFLPKKKYPIYSRTPSLVTTKHTETMVLLGSIVVIIFDGILIATLLAQRTTELLPSPWQAVPVWFFILFAISSFILLFTLSRTKQFALALPVSSLHLFTMFSVAAFIYPLGFGFDAFVHRATEAWIQTHGFILPKTPYYIGQYSLVVWLAKLTSLPIFYLDVYLVPALASLTLPPTVLWSLKRAWNIPPEKSGLALWLLPSIPFLSLSLTTPYNLAILLTILTVFILLPMLTSDTAATTAVFLSAATLATHPLIGAPLCLFVVASIGLKSNWSQHKKSLLLLVCLVGITLVVPLLFIINNWHVYGQFPSFTTPLQNLKNFLQLFTTPYWHYTQAPFRWQLLYAWAWLIVPVYLSIGALGFLILRKKKKIKHLWLYPASALGLAISAWLLRSWIVFPEVVAYEQGDYPLRLLKAAVIFALPFAMYGAISTAQFLWSAMPWRNMGKTATFVAASLLLTISLYLSYPQRNAKVRFPGLNVTASDFRTVEWIHSRESGYNYIVLANQLVSAAALTKYSFAKYFATPRGQIFYYSLPTGGLLYEDYGRMLYQGQKREFMTHAMNLAGVDTAYFVVNSYWANSFNIIAGAKKTADSWKVIDGGEVWVFVYDKK